jgi:hypothetical protein
MAPHIAARYQNHTAIPLLHSFQFSLWELPHLFMLTKLSHCRPVRYIHRYNKLNIDSQHKPTRVSNLVPTDMINTTTSSPCNLPHISSGTKYTLQDTTISGIRE